MKKYEDRETFDNASANINDWDAQTRGHFRTLWSKSFREQGMSEETIWEVMESVGLNQNVVFEEDIVV